MSIAPCGTSFVVLVAVAGLLVPGELRSEETQPESTKLTIGQQAVVNDLQDNLGDFLATYRYDRQEIDPPGPGERPAPPRVSSGVYQVCRKGSWMRISLTGTEAGGVGASGATIHPLPSGRTWLFKDGKCVAFIDGANYVEDPEPRLILDSLPPFGSMGMVLTKDGEFKTESEIAEAKPLEERPIRTIEQRGESVCEVIASRRTLESAHATVSGRGLVRYDAEGRRSRIETHSVLTFPDGRSAELPGRVESVDRWIDGLPSHVEVTIYPRGRRIWDRFQAPEDVSAYMSEGEHVPSVQLTMELTNVRDPAASDPVSPSDFAPEMAFVRVKETDPPRPVWSGAPGESQRLLQFDPDSTQWQAAPATP